MVRVETAFPGGNAVVESVESDAVVLRCDLRDTQGWWFWWQFQVRGAAGRPVVFRFTDPESPIGRLGPAVSEDNGGTWRWLGAGAVDGPSFRYAFSPDAEAVRFAFSVPYTQANLDSFLAAFALRAQTLCVSRRLRTVECLRLGGQGGGAAHRVILTARHHCCESIASYVMEGAIEAALTSAWFREHVELRVVPFVDKDGVEEGDQGKNRRPHDHGRDYSEPGRYPETRAIRRWLAEWGDGRPWVWIDLHCPWIRGPHNECVYIVGKAEPCNWAEQQRFATILEETQAGCLGYRAADTLPFGQAWNTGANYGGMLSPIRWAVTQPGLRLATTIEVPYANANGHEVTVASARAFGRGLARSLQAYLSGA